MYKLIFLMIIINATDKNKLLMNDLKDVTVLEDLLEIDDNSIKFIAFYNKDDISDLDIKHINDFYNSVNKLKNDNYNVSFYLFIEKIPKNLQIKHHIYKYTLPKIKMNKNGKLITYKGSLKSYSILNFIKREYRDYKMYYDKVKVFEDLKDFYNRFDEIILYIGDQINPKFVDFIEKTKKFKEIKFLYSQNLELNDDILSKLSKNEKKYIGGIPYLYFIKRSISQFLEIFVVQHSEFSNFKNYLKMMRKSKLYKIPSEKMSNFIKYNEPFLMLISQNGLYEKETEEICYEINEIKCTQFDDSFKEFDNFSKYLDHKRNTESIYIIDPTKFVNTKPFKYKFIDYITKDNIKKFIYDWKNNKLKPYLRSQEIINNKNNIVYEIVTDNMEEEIKSSKNDVLLFIYSENCIKCDDFKIEYLKVAQYIKKYLPNIPVSLMMINNDKNEIPNLLIEHVPTFFIYSRKNYITPTRANFELSFGGLMYFIKNKSPFLNELETKIDL